MIWAALILAQSVPDAPPPPLPPEHLTDPEFCEAMKDIAKSATNEAPIKVDAITRLDGMSVICSLRTVATNHFVDADESSFREGWQARKQAQWNEIICKNEGFATMARRGWRFAHNIVLRSGKRLTQDAHCQ